MLIVTTFLVPSICFGSNRSVIVVVGIYGSHGFWF